jgi:hypothetical protein
MALDPDPEPDPGLAYLKSQIRIRKKILQIRNTGQNIRGQKV